VIEPPETRYTTTADGVDIAYQAWGQGSFDLVTVRDGYISIDTMWEEPQANAFFKRLGSFARNICFDVRGTGSSDSLGLPSTLNLDWWMDDIEAVMDAAGSDRAALVGLGENGPASMLYAASHPERVSALVLFNSYARFLKGPDYPCGLPHEKADRFLAAVRETWATMAAVEYLAPSMVANEGWSRWYMRSARLSTSPNAAVSAMRNLLDTRVPHVLPSIQAPTLVVHRRGDRHVRVEHGRYLAEHIRGAQYRELDGEDHLFFAGDTDALADEIEEFLTGVRPVAVTDRVLATVLFTDIVDSSTRAAQLGDRAWRKLLDAHDAVVRTQLERFRGREVNTTGDGFLATFDGPARAIHCAKELTSGLRALDLAIRAGVHTGEVEVRGDDIGGIAVHTGARVAALARAGEVLVSSTVKDLVAGSGIAFESRGEHELKGVPGSWKLFAVTS